MAFLTLLLLVVFAASIYKYVQGTASPPEPPDADLTPPCGQTAAQAKRASETSELMRDFTQAGMTFRFEAATDKAGRTWTDYPECRRVVTACVAQALTQRHTQWNIAFVDKDDAADCPLQVLLNSEKDVGIQFHALIDLPYFGDTEFERSPALLGFSDERVSFQKEVLVTANAEGLTRLIDHLFAVLRSVRPDVVAVGVDFDGITVSDISFAKWDVNSLGAGRLKHLRQKGATGGASAKKASAKKASAKKASAKKASAKKASASELVFPRDDKDSVESQAMWEKRYELLDRLEFSHPGLPVVRLVRNSGPGEFIVIQLGNEDRDMFSLLHDEIRADPVSNVEVCLDWAELPEGGKVAVLELSYRGVGLRDSSASIELRPVVARWLVMRKEDPKKELELNMLPVNGYDHAARLIRRQGRVILNWSFSDGREGRIEALGVVDRHGARFETR